MKFYTNVDVHRGRICETYYENGTRHFEKKDFCPSLFVRTNKRSDYKDLFGKAMEQINFGSISEFHQYKHSYKKTFDFYGDIESKYQFISEDYPDLIEYNSKDIRVFLYDIEVINIENDPKLDGFPKPEEAKVPIVSISIKDLKSKIMWVLTTVEYNSMKTELNLDCKIIHKRFRSEEDLLKAFVTLFERKRPDVLIGWYNKGFDDSYVLNRMSKVLSNTEMKKLSPSGVVKYSFRENKFGKIEPSVTIQGIQILDYMELYKKFIPGGRESFSLDFICKHELGEEKVKYADFDSLKEFYISDSQKATDYNIYDVELIHLLDKKLQLIELVFTMAYMAKINYEDVLSPIKTWECMIYNHLKPDMIVIPPKKHHERESYPGAYVHNPKPGIYDWVITEDLDSLYPHLIMQFNISTETLVDLCEDVDQVEVDERILHEKLKGNPKYIMAGSGQYFRKDIKGLFPVLMEDLYGKRKAVKKEMIQRKIEKENTTDQQEIDRLTNEISRLHNIQLTFKLFLNSLYGALGSPYCRYFEIRMAKAITMSGQLAIRYIYEKLDVYLKEKFNVTDKFLYADTDSCEGSTIVKTGSEDITIEDLYEQIHGKMIVDDKVNDNFVKECDTHKAYGVNREKEIVLQDIKYIKKHKVKKKFYKITVKGKSVTITEDHSIVILRNNELIGVKPGDVKKGDKIIHV